jgi:hypothetical protein
MATTSRDPNRYACGPIALALSAVAIVAERAHAHGVGVRYELPIPLWLYLVGAGLTVALSFGALAFFVHTASGSRDHGGVTVLRSGPGRHLVASGALLALRAAGVGIYVMLIYAGLFGAQSPLKNITPVMVWAVWWVGMVYVSALLGNVWTLLNPLDTLFAWGEALHARLRPARPLAPRCRYPERLGAWPAVALFVVFIWMELVWERSDHPAPLAAAMLSYSALTWTAMLLFGRAQWLCRGEVFSLVFGLVAGFAPAELRATSTGGREFTLRPYAVGLLARRRAGASRVGLVIVLLAAVTFDGFMETPLWAALATPVGAGAWLRTAGVVAAPLLFLTVYLLSCRLIAWCGGTQSATWHLAGAFVMTLVPIAIAYHLAHYLSFLAAASQYLIPLASDPFGFGWDLFGTRNAFVRPGLIGARAIWYVSVAAIVAGHAAAVYLAHSVALEEFPDRRSALMSQWPMLILMVGYTMTSLWIISQPIVTRRFG